MYYFLDLCLICEAFMTLFKMKCNFSTSLERCIVNFWYLECSTTIRCPFVSRLALNSGNDLNLVCNYKWRIEPHTELANNVILHSFAFFCYFLHKLFWPTLSNCTQIVNQIFSGHSDSIIFKNYLIFSRDNFNIDWKILIGLT